MALESFQSFLQSISRSLGGDGPITVVMGNEAGDPDSMVSALSLAYLLHHSPSEASRSIVPMFNFPRADLPIRPECGYVFEHAFPDSGPLAAREVIGCARFVDEIDLDLFKEKRDLRLVLTDHNRLASVQSKFGSLVCGIVDHHADENAYPATQCPLRIISPVGSCCTLVARQYVDAGIDLASTVPPQLATLILGPILHDTDCLSKESGRVKDVDVSMALLLSAIASGTSTTATLLSTPASPDSSLPPYFASYAQSIKAAKKSLRSLTSPDLLRRDFKLSSYPLPHTSTTAAVGFSTVSWDVDKWVKRDGPDAVVAAIVEFSAAMEVDAELVMLHRTGDADKFERQMVVAVKDTGKVSGWFVEEMVECAELKMEPYKLKKSGSEWKLKSNTGIPFTVKVFVQGNPAMSRKLVG
ncbi:DHH phosphoesterase [Gonapodya prolifera JEL478]|uniref:DHH phosphoesterase n=1 Tax=Gonapodya prolifera (strain JEL478) TaxID=1344416 RepID=A0A139AP04_GONPJ|nr:DHH phosphoesterase [Gonapodya prolifera JEL478]|eukprot:KXS18458.1 DHH phosphoesterase [Gonapodya prolifera JEL478]